MSYIKNFLSCVFIGVLLLGGCKCKDNKNPDTTCTEANTVKLPQDAIDRFFFKTGSYWIYKDSLSNLTDSFWLNEHF